MISWTTIEDTLHGWLTSSTGLSTDKVIWEQQNSPRPDTPYISIRSLSIIRIGQDWVQSEDTPGSPPAGEEVTLFTRGQRELTVSLQAFGAAGLGSSSPVALLEAAKHGANLQSQRDAFVAAGMGLARWTPVQSIDGALGSSVFEPRATMEVTILLSTEISETGTSIDTVEIEDLTNGNTFTVP